MTRHQLYFLLVILSWVCFSYNTAWVGRVLIEWPAPLGLLSYLHWTYWAALGLLILASAAVFLDPPENSEVLFILILLTFGLYLQGVTALLEANARNPDSYQNLATVRNLLHAGHIDFAARSTVGSYQSWPGAHYILATLLLSSGLTGSAQVFKYLPLASPFYIVAITQAVGRRLSLTSKERFVLSLLPLASTLGWDDYPASFVGQVLVWLFLMVALSPWRSRASAVLLMVLAAGAIVTHAISGAALLLSSIGLWLFGRIGIVALALLVVMMGTWYLNVAGAFIVGFVIDLRLYWLNILQAYFQPVTYKTVGPLLLSRLVLRYSQLFFFVVYVLLGLRHILWVMFRARGNPVAPTVRATLAILIMLVPLAVVLPLGEGVPRLVVITSIWMALLLVLTRPRVVTVVALLMLFPIALVFARFAGEGVWPYVASSTLRGAEFFATTVDPPRPPNTFFAYHRVPSLIVYFNPAFLVTEPMDPISFMTPSALTFDTSHLTHDPRVEYIILDKQGHDAALWSFGDDPVMAWRRAHAEGMSKIYDSGNVEIYERIGPAAVAQP